MNRDAIARPSSKQQPRRMRFYSGGYVEYRETVNCWKSTAGRIQTEFGKLCGALE